MTAQGKYSLAIIGTVGVPACYGGFETLAENLVRSNKALGAPYNITVYCSSKEYQVRPTEFLGAKLKYIPLYANGKASTFYDIWSILNALFSKIEIILLLGVSGAIALPLLRILRRKKVVTNIDGIEWRREKWQGFAKKFLKFSEAIAVKYSDEIISDNVAIQKYINDEYGLDSHVIAYGGEHSFVSEEVVPESILLPEAYAFALCRIEPENNVHVVLEAFAKTPSQHLVFVGNWSASAYGLNLKHQYGERSNILLVDPIYELGILATLRNKAKFYIHGHSAGGTNPSLVEAMHFGLPIIAYDCEFNRLTTENEALFFDSAEKLLALIENTAQEKVVDIGRKMKKIAECRYTWNVVAQQYFNLLKS